jgi:hypothetical protein
LGKANLQGREESVDESPLYSNATAVIECSRESLNKKGVNPRLSHLFSSRA